MNRIEEMKARHAAELAKEERTEAILAQLSIQPKFITFAYGERPCIHYAAKTLADALVILRSFEAVAFADVKSGWRSFRPLDWFDAKDLERATSITESAAGGTVLRISGGKGFGPNAELTRWVKLPSGEVADVGVDLGVYPCGEGFPAKWYVASDVEYDRNGGIKSASHRPPTIASDLSVTWGGGSRDAYSFGWAWLEPNTFDNEMARFMAQS